MTGDYILALDDRVIERVTVSEWCGAEIAVRSLTALERDQWERDTYLSNGSEAQINWENMRARLVSLCAIDDDGHRLFNDAARLGTKNAKAVDRLFAAAQRVSGLGPAETDEIAKNYSGRSGASSSA